MDPQQAFFESKFEVAFLRTKGDAFQALFEKLMGLAYRADFLACRPWGAQGDRKNDGLLRSERRLFQVYAPNEMTALDAQTKIKEDFEGAKAHWRSDFDTWVFVHNARRGLPPDVIRLLLDLQNSNPGITVEAWGFEKLIDIFRRLKIEDMQSWFGFSAPTAETMAALEFKDLRVVLENIAAQVAPPGQPIREVPKGKIEANALSESVATLLKAGMAKAPLVQEFFQKWHDPSLGERIATSFRMKYRSLRTDLTPNEVFFDLQKWAGGELLNTPEHQLAVLTVMAYYFDSCDIFEEPRGDGS